MELGSDKASRSEGSTGEPCGEEDIVISRAARVNLEMPVGLMLDDSGHGFLGRSVNVSRTGVLVLSEETKPPGTVVRFKFPEFKGLGEVVWTQESEPGSGFFALLGIKYLDLLLRDRKVLEDLLNAPGDAALAGGSPPLL